MESFSFLILTSNSLGWSPAAHLRWQELEPVLSGTYYGCQNCISGHADANDTTHHTCKDVAHYLNEYTQ